jgi:hypothetical protein
MGGSTVGSLSVAMVKSQRLGGARNALWEVHRHQTEAWKRVQVRSLKITRHVKALKAANNGRDKTKD